MALTPFSEDVQVIHKLGDRPIVDNNLTVQQFKDKFDEASGKIKSYINGTLIPEIESDLAEKEIFLATYQSTEYEEVAEADTAGKIVLCLYNGRYYLLTKPPVPGDTNYYFTSPATVSNTGVSVYSVYVDYLNVWHATSATVKPATIPPLMDGEADVGSVDSYARADHVHPSDTSKYEKPVSGIPASDLDSDVQASLDKADTAYQRPYTGIPASALAIAVRTSLNKANSAYQKPANGIPSSDIDPEALPKPAAYAPQMDGVAAKGISSLYAREDHVHPSDTSKITMPSGGSVGQVLKKTANGTEWANESGSGGAEKVFWATYGVTTNAEIDAAYSAGKVVLVEHNDMIAVLTTISVGDDFAEFCAAYGDHLYTYSCESDTWSSHNRVLGTYSKPSGGIPASDLASGVIPTVPSAATAAPADLGTAAVGSSSKYAKEDHVHKLPTLSDLGAEPAWSAEANIQDGAVTKSLSERVSCLFTGALTSLTITLGGDATGHYHFDFSTGSTAPTLTLPSAVLTPDGFTVEANKAYEVDILNKHAAIQSWSLP